ncbi:MAG: FkbM family methyltransferase [Opitutales bacterium]|nr:FkbM family methyltransferase [Opitutales bacterium]
MKPSIIRRQFVDGEIDKQTYIFSIYKYHELLHDYCNIISNTNISSIQILSDAVIVGLKDPEIQLIAPEGEWRTAAIESVNFGNYEASEIRLIRSIVQSMGSEIRGFVDVGANAGFYSLAIAKLFPKVKVYSFEPVPQTFELLTRNIKINGLSDIVAFPLGLSDEPGKFTFHTYPSHSVAASRERLLDSVVSKTVSCDLDTMDHAVSLNSIPVDFIKCDVEGGELFVFKGGYETIKNNLPVVFSEMLRKWCHKFNYHPNDIIMFFSDLGYDCFAIGECGLTKCPVVDDYTKETNYIFFHRKKHSSLIKDDMLFSMNNDVN